jgi:UTP---glucose-1-phosphate uridylyltransferase
MTLQLECQEQSLELQEERLRALLEEMRRFVSIKEKLSWVASLPEVEEFLSRHPFLISKEESSERQWVINSVIAIGQGHIFDVSEPSDEAVSSLEELIQQLLVIERFYAEIGGIIGYQQMTLRLLRANQNPAPAHPIKFKHLKGRNISVENREVSRAILWGIDHLPDVAEIYPVGGAADRLRLSDEKSGLELPAARLLFCGRTLLEGMIRDLQAKEYLYFKLKGKQLVTPVAMMTSREKENHAQILSICEEKNWFGRPKESFMFFCQPSVPAMNTKGQWCMHGPLQLLSKPGGHGVIWKLARDCGVFDQLFALGRKKALLRQINNPIAGVDYALLAFTGIGARHDKAFGFASCPRLQNAAEGVNVLVEIEKEGLSQRVLTNIEYPDLKKYNMAHWPAFSNTNILFADLKEVERAASRFPIPGLLVNLKKSSYKNQQGLVEQLEIVRLESTMQNIADYFATPANESDAEEELKCFLTVNKRSKTISTAKREFVLGSSLLETPEGCFLDLLKNAHELLSKYCKIETPQPGNAASFFAKGPSFLFFYHPALGPLYSIIAQKVRKGRMARGAELQLEITEADIEGLDLEGSLLILAKQPLGSVDEEGQLTYTHSSAKCTLRSVKVRNQGMDRRCQHVFWKNEIYRKQSCTIILHGSGEFFAANITLRGNLHIEVEEGMRVIAFEENGELRLRKERIEAATWHWDYLVDEEERIKLKRLEKN